MNEYILIAIITMGRTGETMPVYLGSYYGMTTCITAAKLLAEKSKNTEAICVATKPLERKKK